MIWDLETEGKPADTPERRASLQRAVEQRVAEIADPRRARLLPDRDAGAPRPPAPAGRAGRGGRGERGPRPARPDRDPAPFAAGAGARLAGLDLDGSRQERALLGALLERPALLHILAEDVADLPIANPELARLRQRPA